MYSITFYNYVVNSIQLQLELHLEVGKKNHQHHQPQDTSA